MYLKQLKKTLLTKEILLNKFQNKTNLNLTLKLNLNLFYSYTINSPNLTKFTAVDLVVKKNNIYNLINSSVFIENTLINFRPKLNFLPNTNKRVSNKNFLKSLTFTHKLLFYLILFKVNDFKQDYFLEKNVKNYDLNFDNNTLTLLKNISSHNNNNIYYSSKTDWTINLFFRLRLKNLILRKTNFLFTQLYYMNLNSILKF